MNWKRSYPPPQILTDKERYIALSKEFAELKIIVAKFKEYKKVRSEIDNLKAMTKDKEVREMAEAEIIELEKKEQALSTELEYLLSAERPQRRKRHIHRNKGRHRRRRSRAFRRPAAQDVPEIR